MAGVLESTESSSSSLALLDTSGPYVWSDKLLQPRSSTYPSSEPRRPTRVSVWPSFISVLQSEVCVALPQALSDEGRDQVHVEVEVDGVVAQVFSNLVWLNERTFGLKLSELTATTKCLESKHIKLRVLMHKSIVIGRALLLMRSGQDELRRLLQALDKSDVTSPEIAFIMQNFIDKLDKPYFFSPECKCDDYHDDKVKTDKLKKIDSYVHMTGSNENKLSNSDLKRAVSLTAINPTATSDALHPRDTSPPLSRAELLSQVTSELVNSETLVRDDDQLLLDSFAFMPTPILDSFEASRRPRKHLNDDVKSSTLPSRKEASKTSKHSKSSSDHYNHRKHNRCTSNSGTTRVWDAVKSLTRRRGYISRNSNNNSNNGASSTASQKKGLPKKSGVGTVETDGIKEKKRCSSINDEDDLVVKNMISWLHDKASIEEDENDIGTSYDTKVLFWPKSGSKDDVVRGQLQAKAS